MIENKLVFYTWTTRYMESLSKLSKIVNIFQRKYKELEQIMNEKN